MQLGRMEFLDSNGQAVLTADNVRVRFEKMRWIGEAQQVQLRRADFTRLWEAIDHRWLRAVSVPHPQFRIVAQEVKLTYNDQPAESQETTSYEQVSLELRAADDLRSCQLRLPGSASDPLSVAPVEYLVTEDLGEQVTHFKLLAQAGLPARLLSTDLVEFAGADCMFFGQVHGVRQRGVWTSRIVDSQLTNVDFAKLSPGHLTIAGRGQVSIGQAQLIDGRLNVAEGLITGGAGQVAPQTLQSVARYLEVEPAAHPDRPMLLDYAQLSVEFKLHSAGLDLKGNCPTGEHVILVDHRGGALLRSRAYWARRERVLRGLMMSAVHSDAVGRRAPYPVMAGGGDDSLRR